MAVRNASQRCTRAPTLRTAQSFYFSKSLTAHRAEHPVAGTAHIIPSACATQRLDDPATSEDVWEMEQGIFAGWVHDALGYHASLEWREQQPGAEAENPELADDAPPHTSPEGEEVRAEVDVTTAVEEEDAESAQPTEALCHNSNKKSNSSSGSGRGRKGTFPFYGPLASFEVSPVFEWLGCLWQWRPIEVRLARHPRSFSRTAAATARGGDGEVGTNGFESNATAGGRHFYLAPFLLLPTNEVLMNRPRLHPELRDAVIARHARVCEADNRAPASASLYEREVRRLEWRGMSPSVTAALWMLTAPTPVGELKLDVGDYRDAYTLSVFNVMERWLANTPHARDSAAAVAPPLLLPPTEETWEAATRAQSASAATSSNDGDGRTPPRETVLAAPYVRIYSPETNEEVVAREGAEPAASAASTHPSRPSQLLSFRRNVIGGGLAELLLTVDRYAALIARGELTLSAACWATLCDTKSWWLVQRLRLTPREVERDLVAATAAHRRWQRRALMRNRTMVGKSSHGVSFDEYPSLVRWTGN
ncbi:hypothetical protein ABB37_07451 [Leptomonas pyrrhocoris]|uniref:Uncharacterized protein n=1 Tax=Leptomonas pyrrhocoris TaxID=157538 RepID=A0A0N0DT53_LEPPY|nr:hypothetical protein ABB37_07451 [Leptomonas pyrrhocoris]KPA76581.1 hypothetical protein ABB37_07451 [Leptomonas pyrrhocoris]|eukprot:XP_015655020.1 hypothetical protein ABB37_07451 [Leptomonas pyrrhocoris]